MCAFGNIVMKKLDLLQSIHRIVVDSKASMCSGFQHFNGKDATKDSIVYNL